MRFVGDAIMLKKTYFCDMCGEAIDYEDGFGLRFISNHDFVMCDMQSTDGKHLCKSCYNNFVEIITQQEGGE